MFSYVCVRVCVLWHKCTFRYLCTKCIVHVNSVYVVVGVTEQMN